MSYDPHACDDLTAMDILLESVKKICTRHSAELTGTVVHSIGAWRELHHDLWASYMTYLYDQQHAEGGE